MAKWVHELTDAYRAVVNAMSYPGTAYDFTQHFADNPFPDQIDDSILLYAAMLLDNEVTFHVIGKAAEQISDIIKKMTFSNEVAIDEADYVFLLTELSSNDMKRTLSLVKQGDLVDPHQSATIVYYVDDLAGSASFELSGPGIQTSQQLAIDGCDALIEQRNRVNTDYPMGIDIVLLSRGGQVLALPRTTKIVRQ